MKIRIVLSIALYTFIFNQNIIAQSEYPNLDDQSGGITEGYGTWGNYEVIREPSDEVPSKGIITLYHTDEVASKRPTVFFISGWGRTTDSYDKFFRFIVSHGYTVVNIYNYEPGSISTSYPNALDMIKQSAIDFSEWIDTRSVGLMGHSFGGGAAIWLGNSLFGDTDNWGKNGRFIFTTTPWLTFLTTREMLQTYPQNTKLHIQLSNDDVSSDTNYTWNTDPRAIRAVFELINIPNEDKDYIRLSSDPDRSYQYDGITYTYDADHYVSYTGVDYQPYDELDVYALNRLAHAMLDYVFEGNEAAKIVALGNGSNDQIEMGNLPDLEETDLPIITRDVNQFKYRCNETTEGSWGDPDIWFLQNYCGDEDNDGLIDSLEESVTSLKSSKNKPPDNFRLNQNYPNPFNPTTNISFSLPNDSNVRLTISNVLGQEIEELINENKKADFYNYTFDGSSYNSGVYYYRITADNFFETKRMILIK